MLKGDLVTRIAEKTGYTKKDCAIFLDHTIEALLEGLGEDGAVRLTPMLGKFEVVQRAPRKAHNPITGETIDVPAHNAVKFTPSRPVKEMFRD